MINRPVRSYGSLLIGAVLLLVQIAAAADEGSSLKNFSAKCTRR